MESTVETKVKRFEKFATQHKKDGNWKKAVEAYTQVIKLLPGRRSTSTYLSRAECYCLNKEWIPARLDCKKVLKQDPSKAKAHCILGICLREMGEFPECVKELEKALELAKHQSVPFDDFTDLNSIRKELVKANDSRLLELEELRKACRYKIEEQLKYDLCRERKDDYCSQLKLIDELFSKASKAEQPKEVPDFLMCPITLDVFTDPVITPCGQTYDRQAILQHLAVQETPHDPKTRKPLRVEQLIANNAIRRCVDYYRQD